MAIRSAVSSCVSMAHRPIGDRFGRFVPVLAEAGHHVVTMDLRGRGCSEITPSGSYGWDSHVRDLLEIAEHYGADSFVMIGHSTGGFIGLSLAAQYPRRCSHLVLIDAVGEPEPSALPTITKSAADWAGHIRRQRRCCHTCAPPAPLLRGMSSGKATSRGSWNRSTTPSGFGPIPFLGCIDAPTLVVCGDYDRAVPPANSRLLAARIRDARLVTIQAGHDLQKRGPAAVVAQLVEQFLDSETSITA